jgi:hypothetical protein
MSEKKRTKKRRTEPTKQKVTEFLELLSQTGIVSTATKALNLDRMQIYKMRNSDPEFRAAWDHALEQAAETLEAEARRRALEGVEEPVWYQGAQVGYTKRYSDILLMFLLKGNNPEKFKERSSNELTGAGGAPLTVEITRTIIKGSSET